MRLQRISLALVTLLLLSGCGSKAPQPAPGPGTSQPPAPSPQPKPPEQPTPQPGTTPQPNQPTHAAPTNPADTESTVRGRAAEVLNALAEKDRTKLAALVHPTKGVRFSPYAYVRTGAEGDLLFTPDQLTSLDPKTVYVWGVWDGKGDPMKMTFDQFLEFAYRPEYKTTTHVSYDKVIKSGNSTVNITEAYPGSHFVEYHFPGTQANSELDWTSLRLIFEQQDGKWYLIGLTRDQWTI